jgi:hypothetical protein
LLTNRKLGPLVTRSLEFRHFFLGVFALSLDGNWGASVD